MMAINGILKSSCCDVLKSETDNKLGLTRFLERVRASPAVKISWRWSGVSPDRSRILKKNSKRLLGVAFW